MPPLDDITLGELSRQLQRIESNMVAKDYYLSAHDALITRVAALEKDFENAQERRSTLAIGILTALIAAFGALIATIVGLLFK